MKISIIFKKDVHESVIKQNTSMYWVIDTPSNREFFNESNCILPIKNIVRFFDVGSAGNKEQVLVDIIFDITKNVLEWESIEIFYLEMSAVIMGSIISNKSEGEEFKFNKKDHGFEIIRKSLDAISFESSQWIGRVSAVPKLELTDRALEKISRSLAAIRNRQPNEDLVPSLGWGPRGIKRIGDERWTDLGPGYTLGFFKREKVPPETIIKFKDLEIILQTQEDLSDTIEVYIDYSDKQYVIISKSNSKK